MTTQPQNDESKDWDYEIGNATSGKFLRVVTTDGVLRIESNSKGGLGCLLLTLSAPMALVLSVASCVSSPDPVEEPAVDSMETMPVYQGDDLPRLQSPVACRP